MKLPIAALLLCSIACAGCQTTLLSNDRIASATAGILGVPVSEVSISERRTDGPTNTFYTATTRKGSYACIINGGSALSMGIVNPPTCNKK